LIHAQILREMPDALHHAPALLQHLGQSLEVIDMHLHKSGKLPSLEFLVHLVYNLLVAWIAFPWVTKETCVPCGLPPPPNNVTAELKVKHVENIALPFHLKRSVQRANKTYPI